MIKLTKGNEPAVLAANKVNWTNQLMGHINANQVIPKALSTQYNQDEVKDALRLEGYSKCMYCESKVEHITDLHIEHIKPKARDKFPELTFEFDNLGLACPLCNRNKSSTYDNAVPFINPYIDEPTTHFYSIGAFIFAKPNDPRAKLTEIEIDLNRTGLIETRGEKMKAIRELIDSYHSQPNLTVKASIKKQILREVGNDKIYSLCCKTFVDSAT
jgi:5-methylcytosine-specific restriction endonuclease McrA